MLRHFRIFPEDADPDNLNTEQREFLVYLSGSAPGFDDFRNWLFFHDEVDEVEKTDFLADQNETVLSIAAKSKGMSLTEYKEYENRKKREARIKELQKEYGFHEEQKTKKSAVEYFRELSEKISKDDTGRSLIDKLMTGPDV